MTTIRYLPQCFMVLSMIVLIHRFIMEEKNVLTMQKMNLHEQIVFVPIEQQQVNVTNPNPPSHSMTNQLRYSISACHGTTSSRLCSFYETKVYPGYTLLRTSSGGGGGVRKRRRQRKIQEITLGEHEIDLNEDKYLGLVLNVWIYLFAMILVVLMICFFIGTFCYCCRCGCYRRNRNARMLTKIEQHNKQQHQKQQKSIANTSVSNESIRTTETTTTTTKEQQLPPNSPMNHHHYHDDGNDVMQDIDLDDEDSVTDQTKTKKGWFQWENPFNNGKRMSLDC